MKARHATEKFDSIIKAGWFIPADDFEFISLPYQRSVGSAHVNKIMSSLKEQKVPHFNEPLVVNVRSKKQVVLLDGYHRWEAMKKFNEKVKIKFEVYEGLSKEEEKKIYEEYNIGKKHNALDIIRPLLDDTKYEHLKALIDRCEIPLLVYRNKKMGIPMTRMVLWYKQQNKKTASRESLVDYMKGTFNTSDVDRICDWSFWYTATVGEYAPNSRFFKGPMMSVMMYIYHNTMRLELLEKRLKDFKFDGEMVEHLNSATGFTGFKMLLPVISRHLNKGLIHKII